MCVCVRVCVRTNWKKRNEREKKNNAANCGLVGFFLVWWNRNIYLYLIVNKRYFRAIPKRASSHDVTTTSTTMMKTPNHFRYDATESHACLACYNRRHKKLLTDESVFFPTFHSIRCEFCYGYLDTAVISAPTISTYAWNKQIRISRPYTAASNFVHIWKMMKFTQC